MYNVSKVSFREASYCLRMLESQDPMHAMRGRSMYWSAWLGSSLIGRTSSQAGRPATSRPRIPADTDTPGPSGADCPALVLLDVRSGSKRSSVESVLGKSELGKSDLGKSELVLKSIKLSRKEILHIYINRPSSSFNRLDIEAETKIRRQQEGSSSSPEPFPITQTTCLGARDTS